MKITIAYAVPGRQVVQPFDVAEGTTIESAIRASGILEQLPQVDLARNKVGIYGKAKALDTVVTAGDRIEIYHPITIDPKSVPKRKTGAAKAPKAAGGGELAEAGVPASE